MAEGHANVTMDFSGGMLILGVFALIILFWGEPDLHEAIIHRLMGPDAAVVQTDVAE